MIPFLLEPGFVAETEACEECGAPATVRTGDRLLCSACALKELEETSEDATAAIAS